MEDGGWEKGQGTESCYPRSSILPSQAQLARMSA